MASRLWKFLNTDILELGSLDTVEGSKDAADAVLGLAEVLQTEGPNVQQLAPLVTQLDSLLDVLNSPLGNIVGASLPFVPIATGLLKFYLEKTKQEPTLAQSVALISQVAYLESFRRIAQENSSLRDWIAQVDKQAQTQDVTPEVKALSDFKLNDYEARFALLHFHQSALAKEFNRALIARLVHLGTRLKTAENISEKVTHNVNRYMRSAIADAKVPIKRIVEWYHIHGDADFEKYLSIDTYLEKQIATLPGEKVFAESFTLREIYIPQKARLLTREGKQEPQAEPLVLQKWVQDNLNDDSQKSQVIFIQGDPGRGKSVFCRMFADWVRRHEPRWTPILIRLRNVELSSDFEQMLAKGAGHGFAKNDPGWLTDRNVNFLFILDGFDELLMEGRTSSGLEDFLRRVGRFQEQCACNSDEMGHRVLLTGRTLALQTIERQMPPNLARIEILPMDDDLQHQWFKRWGALIGQDQPHLMEILPDQRLPERLRELAREPLLLYLLAAMYRDGELRIEMFEQAQGAQAKVSIYKRTLDWVLTKQRPGWLNRNLTEIEISGLRRILQEAGLCVVQSGMEFARIKAIEDRLSQDSTAKGFLKAAQKRLKTDDSPLRNALVAFYLQEGRQSEGSIEFVRLIRILCKRSKIPITQETASCLRKSKN